MKHKTISILFFLYAIMGQSQPKKAPSGNFETAMDKVLTAAPGNFESIKGADKAKDEKSYGKEAATTVNLGEDADCQIRNSFGVNYIASWTTFSSQTEADGKYNSILNKLDKHLKQKDYYSRSGTLETKYNEYKKSFWGVNQKNGYEDYRIELLMSFKDSKYSMYLFVAGGNRTKYYYTKGGTPSNKAFTDDVKKLMNDIENKFSNEYGEKEENKGLFGKTVKYKLNVSLSPFSCNYYESSMSFGTACTCETPKFSSLEEAQKFYDKIFNVLSTGLPGSAYKELEKSEYTLKGVRMAAANEHGIDNSHAVELVLSKDKDQYEVKLSVGKYIF